MVELVDDKAKASKFTGRLVLGSIRTWKPEGVECNITNVSEIFEDNYSSKPTVSIKVALLESMPKMRVRNIDKEGKVVKKYDEVMDREVEDVQIIENVSDVEIPFYFNLKIVEDSDPEDPIIYINNQTKLFPLVNHAFQDNDLIKEGNKKSIKCSYEELVENLVGCMFIGTVETRDFNNNKYDVLIANPLYETQVVEG